MVYSSGDTVWYEGVAEVARRFSVTVAILNMGAARDAAAVPSHLTFTAAEGVEFARMDERSNARASAGARRWLTIGGQSLPATG